MLDRGARTTLSSVMTPSREEDVDYVLLGAGMSGIFMLAEALQQGFKSVVVIDRKDRIGGLWADLPAWQTIQNRPSDFTMQGFTTRKKVWYARDVLHMLDEYVKVQNLEGYLRLNTEVMAHEWSDEQDRWILKTNGVTYRCKVLILCTGRHAKPFVPAIPTDGSVSMLHSSQVHDFKGFKGKRVAVLGGGASGLDLLINTLRVNEDRPELKVTWVLRAPKYFTGGEGDDDLLKITAGQLASPTGVEMISVVQWGLDLWYRARFVRAGVKDWMPKERLDIHSVQGMPGRSYLLKKTSIKRIDRHCGTEISEIRGGYLHLSNGEVLGPFDYLLLGTGYERPKHPPGTSELLESTRDKLIFRTLVPGRHLGRLILTGEEILDTTTSGPFLFHVVSRFLWELLKADAEGKSETKGTARFRHNSERFIIPTPLVNHLQLLVFAEARAKPGVLTPFLWRAKMWHTYLYYRFVHNTTCLFGDRVLGKNMSLDKDKDCEMP